MSTDSNGAWVAIKLLQNSSNLDAVGAWIEIKADGRTMSREVTIGGGHAGGSALPEHFGLGNAASGEIRVRWPDGVWSGWSEIEFGSVWTVMKDGDELIQVAY